MDTRAKVGVIITNNEDNILLLKEKVKKKNMLLWNIVKGSYGDNGDEDIFEAAKRECMEEVCSEVELTNTLGAYVSKDGDKIRIQFNFSATTNSEPKLTESEEQTQRDECISEIKWFTKDEILKMNPDEFMSNRIFELLKDYISGKKFPLEVYKQVKM